MLWIVIKIQLLLFFFIWLRGTLPRLRYDQFMKLGWKVLIPVSLVWLVMVASVRALRNEGYDFARVVLYVGAPIAALLLLALVWDMLRRKPGTERPAEGGAPAEPAAFDPMAGGYPVPPLPGQELPPVPRRRSRAPQLQDALNGADHSEGS
ncbi:hypothetical protein GCM10025734_49540 [Kitasatospora paranensis]